VFNGPPAALKMEDKSKERWCVLKQNWLYVYKSMQDDSPSESIDISSGAIKVGRGLLSRECRVDVDV
jgi:hypothetical protein